jgi:hypothetical protein
MVTLKVTSCRTMSKKKSEKSEKPRFYGQNKLFLSTLPFSHIVACRSYSKNTGKMNLIPIFNKTSPQAHTELELDVLGVHGKLVKYSDSQNQ